MNCKIISKISSILVPLIILVALASLIFGCEKEPEPTYTTVRKMFPMEGIYKGSYTIKCDSLGINTTVKNHVIMISSFSGELLSINSFTSATAFSSGPDEYHIDKMFWIDKNDCGTKEIAYSFHGTGKVNGTNLTENGIVIMLYNGRKYQGDWSTNSTKQ